MRRSIERWRKCQKQFFMREPILAARQDSSTSITMATHLLLPSLVTLDAPWAALLWDASWGNRKVRAVPSPTRSLKTMSEGGWHLNLVSPLLVQAKVSSEPWLLQGSKRPISTAHLAWHWSYILSPTLTYHIMLHASYFYIQNLTSQNFCCGLQKQYNIPKFIIWLLYIN